MMLKIRRWETLDGEVEKPLSPEDQALLAGDSDELRRADQSAWDRYAKANEITDFMGIEPIAVRILRWEAEDAEREDRQAAGIKKAMASLDRGLYIDHQRVEAWVVSLNSDLERLVKAVE